MCFDPITLNCPLCAGPLATTETCESALTCPAGHRYDAAKQGYFNLLTGRGTAFKEDSASMVQARADFLAAGHYSALAQVLAQEAEVAVPQRLPRLLDAGAGTGYYLDAVAAGLADSRGDRPPALALDISRYAMRRAAKLPRTRALVWDLWRPLPVADAAVDVLLNVFAPRNGVEFARVLSPGGLALVATPLPGHLAEARGPLGLLAIAAGKDESVAAALGPEFEAMHTREIRSEMRLSTDDAVRLATMGPAGHHHDEVSTRARLETHPMPDIVSSAFRLQVFRRR